MMDKVELIKDNLAKIDKAIEAAVHAGDGLALCILVMQRSQFVLDSSSLVDSETTQGGQCSQCGGKETAAEINYQRILNLAIEKARKKAEVRHELPAAIDVVGCGQAVYKPCPHGIDAKVGSGYCTCCCPHFAHAKQWGGGTVYCWYPEKRR